jgi:hypothetical protein
MTEIATAWVQIVPSARGVASQLERELEPAARKAGEKSGQGFAARFEASTGKSLDDFGKKALVGAAAFGAGLLGVSNAAGNLSAALSANSQVLGDSADDVQAWARTSVQQVGLSERATLQAATAFGQLGKVAGLTGEPLAGFSLDMVKLAADMAAFADVPADQAVQDLRAAFAGSTETVQKYNIFLNETELKAALFRTTGERVTGVLTAQQRVLATQAALLEQTSDIQGQAAREAGGLQRAEDNLRASLENTAASIGESTLPAVTGLTNGLASGIGAVGSLNDATNGLVGGLLLVGTTALGAGGSVALVADRASRAVTGFRNLSRAMQITSVASAGVVAGAVAGFTIYDNWRRNQEILKARTDEVAAALADQVRETFAAAEASATAAGEIDGLAAAQRALSNALTGSGEEGEKLTAALGAIGVSAGDALDVLVRLQDGGVPALAELVDETSLTADEVEFLRLALIESEGAFRDWAFSTASASSELSRTNPELEELAQRIYDTRDGAAVISPEMLRVTDALEELNRQAGRSDLDAMAESFLNTTAAGSGLTDSAQELVASLVEQARASATAADGTYDALAAYGAYGQLLGQLTPAQRDLVSGVEATTPAITSAAEAVDEFASVSGSAIDVITGAERAFDRAERQVSAFDSAIDGLIGTQVNLQAAGDSLLEGFAELAQVVTDSANGVEGASTSLDQFSDAGRENRRLVRDQVNTILDYSRGLLDAGASVDEASEAARRNTDQLAAQLQQFGLTESEARDYLATLGLTPETIETAVELYNDEAVRVRLEELLTDLEDIPEERATEIRALIDEGDLAEAERRLNVLARERIVSIRAGGAGGGLGTVRFSALGRYVDRPTLTWAGEGNRPEVILPLTNPARMAELLADPRVFAPIVDALPTVPVGAAAGGAGTRVGMHVEHQTIESGLDLDTAARIAARNLDLVGVGD